MMNFCELADEINWRHGTPEWRPIVFVNEHFSPEEVYLLDRLPSDVSSARFTMA